MAWEHDPHLVRAVARGAVSAAAPDELAQFEVTADAFLAAPRRRRRAARRDEPLGLGLDSVDVLVSTVALTVTVEVLKHLAQHYSDRLLSRTARRLRALVRRRGRRSSAPLPTLDRDQLRALHALAHTKATELQVPDEQARLVADGIVAALALSERESSQREASQREASEREPAGDD